MLNSLQTSVRLLALGAILLIIVITYLMLSPSNENEVAIQEDLLSEQNYQPDPTQMDSIAYASYLKVLEGEKIFKKAGCNSCHDVCQKKTGPALRGVTQRRNRDWIHKAVTNFSALKQSGDKTAIKLVEEYKMEMPAHDFLSPEEIDQIIYFIDSSYCKGDKISASAKLESCDPDSMAVYEKVLAKHEKKIANLNFTTELNRDKTEANIFLKNFPADNYVLSITDASGKTLTKDDFFIKGDKIIKQDISDFTKGVYFIRLRSPSGIGTSKFMIN